MMLLMMLKMRRMAAADIDVCTFLVHSTVLLSPCLLEPEIGVYHDRNPALCRSVQFKVICMHWELTRYALHPFSQKRPQSCF